MNSAESHSWRVWPLLSILLLVSSSTPGLAVVVDFPDENLEAVIRVAIGKPTGDIYDSDLVDLAWLWASSRDISNLAGLEYCTGLTELYLDGNQISDLTPLAGLTSVTVLWLFENQISNLSPLAGLTSLQDLYLDSNQISDIGPLVANSSLGAGDLVGLDDNWLNLSAGSQATQDIQTLRDRGVTVSCENQTPPPTYSISGTVTDPADQPLVGVELTADGHAATTVTDGTYMIQELLAGTYTVTPTFGEYTFTPPSEQVTVNASTGDATDIDFTGAPPLAGDFDDDGDLDIDDANIFITAWIAAHQETPQIDARCDIAPYTGTIPDILSQPDGVIGIDDATLFIQLWIYYHQ